MDAGKLNQALRDLLHELEHLLPAQAPIRDFVHHNTLHGFQHLPFPKALAEAAKITGSTGFLPLSAYREMWREGRIEDADLQAEIAAQTDCRGEEIIARIGERAPRRADVIMAALRYPIEGIRAEEWIWQHDHARALEIWQEDLPATVRAGLDDRTSPADLWAACLEALSLKHNSMHAEDMLDLSPEQAEHILAGMDAGSEPVGGDQPLVHQLVRKAAQRLLADALRDVGPAHTLRGLLLMLTGEDLLDRIRPILIRFLGAWLDHGVAAWSMPARDSGLYRAWRKLAADDLSWLADELGDWRDEFSSLPDEPAEVIAAELRRAGVPESVWMDYLKNLALEIPGWSGMVLWRHQHPGYQDLSPARVDMLDYLAVRLVLERVFAQQLCRRTWRLEANLGVLRWYFGHHRSEFVVRHALSHYRLPEYLTSLAQRLTGGIAEDDYRPWSRLADLIWTWRHGPGAQHASGYDVYRDGWRLFRLAQHLGMDAGDIAQLRKDQIAALFACLDEISPERGAWLWLLAHERHYREKLLHAIVANRGRGAWRTRPESPRAQIVFCMDDREESLRRHLEERTPRVETLGAAGFFNVPINWYGLDDERPTPLCPVVVTPAHEVREVTQDEARLARHRQRRSLRLKLSALINMESRRNLLSSALFIAAAAPLYALLWPARAFAPSRVGPWLANLQASWDINPATRAAVTAEHPEQEASAAHPRAGFSDEEQADRVAGFLRTIGLTGGFAPLMVMMGHGSGSENNPHLAAYDCGACSGRHGGPNARAFAAMANRPEVRAGLRERGLHVPDDCWFLGAEHNTCDDLITWYDQDAIPQVLQDAFHALQNDLLAASKDSAHERNRRFASAPCNPNSEQAWRHVIGRAHDFSQARPELGHATNAAAIIGRRAVSRGAFFDRRVFLISYDATTDAEGKVLEAILLAAGPVGAGINLEYYFSTVDNERYGCGSKITHNVTGLFGIMQGASSDLLTGLPKQMIEIHEPVRLQIVVEARTDILAKIYARQPALQELIGNGWLILIALDPDNGELHLFDRARGFVAWQADESRAMPSARDSMDWYRGSVTPLPPALIEKGVEAGAGRA